jgi:hypothetical protein
MANRNDARPAGLSEDLARESWRLSRMPFDDRRMVEQCLERRGELLDALRSRIREGRAGKSGLEALARCLEEGNALLRIWKEGRAALERELAQRRKETLFLQTGLAGQGSARRRTYRA